MATEYKITYTYKGQGNTSANRSVSFNRFTASGATGRNIAQITSITYEHWHSSTKAMTWNLRGRLVLANGKTFTSNTVGHKISGDTVKFTNTFTNLPTAEQFKTLKSVQTLDSQGKTTVGGYSADLYWRATSDYPMRVTVTFIEKEEEPPVVYAPVVEEFAVTRCDADGNLDDEGTYAITDLKLDIGNTDGLDGAELRIYYAPNAYPVVGVSDYISLTDRIPELLAGVYDDRNLIPGEWNVGYTWYFAAVFIAGNENDVKTTDLARARGSFHVSGSPGGGVCVCGYSTGTSNEPKFESYAPGFFYEGINGVTNYNTFEVDTGGRWIDGKKIYRLAVQKQVTATGSNVVVAELPEAVDLVNIYGCVVRTGTGASYPLTMYVSDTNSHRVWLSGNRSLTVQTTHASVFNVTIEYTKQSEAVNS